MSIQNFMHAVLGSDAATALQKAAERSEEVGSVIGPRVVIGWLGFASQWSYEGEIPGLPGTMLTFKKNQATDLFDGSFGLGDDVYDFQNATLTHLAATLSVALGVARPVAKSLRDSDLMGIGKNIDLLVKSRVIQMAKMEKDDCCEKACKDCGACPAHLAGKAKFEHGGKCLSKGQQESAGSGAQAAPRGPLAPEGPEPQKLAPAMKQPPKPGQQLKVTKSQADSKCSVCEAASFTKGEFTGCYCFKELARFAKSEQTAEGYVVSFGREWTKGNLQVLMDVLQAHG